MKITTLLPIHFNIPFPHISTLLFRFNTPSKLENHIQQCLKIGQEIVDLMIIVAVNENNSSLSGGVYGTVEIF
jgi:hypothetical protein